MVEIRQARQGHGVRRPSAGPAILDRGFRPFFLAAALWAGLLMAMFIAMLAGFPVAAPGISIVDWHAHELLFGYTGAVMAGFLLTAVPNWTKRFPVSGWRLAVLFAVWLAGRLAIAFSGPLGPWGTAAVELAYPVGLALVVGREVIAGRNYRNLRVLVLVALFAFMDAGFLYESLAAGGADFSKRGAVGVIVMLIMLIGGRVIPSFTRNWLAQNKAGPLPVPFGRFDAITMGVSALALVAWTLAPGEVASGLSLILAGALNAMRLARWKGWLTLKEHLVLILHIGFGFVPLGLIGMGVSILDPDLVPPTSAMHLLTAGAIGVMTLAMMTRVSLGHTGGMLRADFWIRAIYWSVLGAVVLRFAYGYGHETMLLHASAVLWILAFALFAVRFGYMAVRLNFAK